MLCRLQGGQHTVIVTVKPRLQKDKWSMYWKESMCTKTECLEAIEVEVDTSSSMSDLTTVSIVQCDSATSISALLGMSDSYLIVPLLPQGSLLLTLSGMMTCSS